MKNVLSVCDLKIIDSWIINFKILTTGSDPILTFFAISIMSNANRAIHFEWFSHESGRPETAIYLSPTVSTCCVVKENYNLGKLYTIRYKVMNQNWVYS
jgi:hypothetical protein